MLSVEFLGPSGVGKTYLYNQLFKAEGLDRRYLSVHDAYISAALKFKQPEKALPVSLLKALLSSRYWNWKRRGIAHKILSYVPVKVPSSAFLLSTGVLDDYLMSESEEHVIQKRRYNFRNRIQQFLMLERSLDENDLVVFDEGMMHYHHGFSPELLSRYTPKQLREDKAIALTAAISVEQSSENIIAQAFERRASGVGTFSHAGLSNSQLRDYILKNIEEYKRKIDFLEMLEIPVLKVDNSEAIGSNVIKINSFLNSLSPLTIANHSHPIR